MGASVVCWGPASTRPIRDGGWEKQTAFLPRHLGSTPPGAPSGPRQRTRRAWGVPRARGGRPAAAHRRQGWSGAALLVLVLDTRRRMA
jgi:hypothetical protein